MTEMIPPSRQLKKYRIGFTLNIFISILSNFHAFLSFRFVFRHLQSLCSCFRHEHEGLHFLPPWPVGHEQACPGHSERTLSSCGFQWRLFTGENCAFVILLLCLSSSNHWCFSDTLELSIELYCCAFSSEWFLLSSNREFRNHNSDVIVLLKVV